MALLWTHPTGWEDKFRITVKGRKKNNSRSKSSMEKCLNRFRTNQLHVYIILSCVSWTQPIVLILSSPIDKRSRIGVTRPHCNGIKFSNWPFKLIADAEMGNFLYRLAWTNLFTAKQQICKMWKTTFVLFKKPIFERRYFQCHLQCTHMKLNWIFFITFPIFSLGRYLCLKEITAEV